MASSLPLAFFQTSVLAFLSVIVLSRTAVQMRSGSDRDDNWTTQAAYTTIRLKPGDDLKTSLLNFTAFHNLQAANIVTCVGSLQRVHVRLASAGVGTTSQFLTKENERFEIVSLVGTLEATSLALNKEQISEGKGDKEVKGEGEGEGESFVPYGHLHISVADKDGTVIGGHLMDGCVVYTTAEITIVELGGLKHQRTTCSLSGYEELDILKRG
jgi:predicted DNA-binding protein with PD1-like motif